MSEEPCSSRVKVSSLELHVADHCCLNCFGCSHFSPEAVPRLYSVADYWAHLDCLLSYAEPEMLSLLGGEPFLHPYLPDFYAAIQGLLDRHRLCTTLKVFTNGFWLRDFERYSSWFSVIRCVVLSEYVLIKSQITEECYERGVQRMIEAGVRVHRLDRSYFSPLNFVTEANASRPSCGSVNCLILNHKGVLARCPTILYALTHSGLSPQHPFVSRSKFFDIHGGTAESLQQFIQQTPESCLFCTYGTESPQLWKRYIKPASI